MKIRLASIEDGIDSIGFRKISAFIKSIHAETQAAYVPTGNVYSLARWLAQGGSGKFGKDDIHVIAQFLAQGDIVGFSAMTQYSSTVCEIIDQIRHINPNAYIIWGGIHAIVYPEEAIKHVDACCTGEGEFAFKAFLRIFKDGKDYTTAPGFWFRTNTGIVKNANLPLIKQKEMDDLPPLIYQDGEFIYRRGEGFSPINRDDFLKYSALSYNTVWSIGCPNKCIYCSNSKFIENDGEYRRIRHSSPSTIIEEIKRAIRKHPHISTINFHDDGFLALPFKVLEEFAKLYKAEIKVPFTQGGAIPNFVREDKIALLLDAGMNRLRMGIQSGSQDILDFYQRPTKLQHIQNATKIINKFNKYMLPPEYDIILENPIETAEDTRKTLDLLRELPRPFCLNVFALRVIPNTELARAFEARGLEIPPIEQGYNCGYHHTLGNVLVFTLAVWKLPKWLFKNLLSRVYPVEDEQPKYPVLFMTFRTASIVKRGLSHLCHMEFSLITGKIGYILWKTGVIGLWRRFVLKRYLPKE